MVTLALEGVVELVIRGFLVFFFQAEDGIRDLTVTGVQTCALPIFASEPLPDPRSMDLFLESERFLLKPLSLDTLWRLVEEAMQGTPQAAKGSRADPQQTRAGRVGGAP